MNRHFATTGLVAVLLVFGSVAAGVAEQTPKKSSQFTSVFPVDKGLDAINAKLDELKPGEMVIISGTRNTGVPPRDQANQVREYCKRIGLKVQ